MRTLQAIMRSNNPEQIRNIPIFQLTEEELAARLHKTAVSVIREAFSKGSYITYFDENVCPDEHHMIHEYQDRKELVRIDDDGEAHYVATL